MGIRTRAWLVVAGATLVAVPCCVVREGVSRAMPALVSCVPRLDRVAMDGQPWTSLGAPLDSVDYRMFWDAEFQTYEVVFRNRSATPMTLHYAARIPFDVAGLMRHRELRPHAADRPPGASVHGARTGAPACVVVDGVDSGVVETRLPVWDE